ncbi:response regulator receiver domain protein [Nostoc sp. HK-01]|uniref:Response regulator receiver domain protein n=2 Tax=Nostocales TaxID=1161 RepID=A0A1Z4GHL1_9CYAN|nr:response regulator [Nostoc cycadae]BAY16987.1 response regulator receiver domain protein [Anabaenopsis circularis NIES-21]BBD58912.1 response regulator receiver domain protein [Nostoc sp. HK-01]GBE91940.1 two-component response regulator [Nostoc cycadae WK-1]
MNGKPLILVVEENIHNLELLNYHLKALNYSCICAKQGIKALIVAQTHQPDLIILDMMISDISGGQVIDYLKREKKTAKIPVIAAIPWYLEQNSERLFLTGTDGYLTKPYDLKKLGVLLSRHLTQLNSSSLL